MDVVGWACTRKRAYETRGLAKRAKRIMAAHKREIFKVYRCPFCLKWHVAHRKQQLKDS